MKKKPSMFILPLVILIIIVVFIFGFEPAFLQGSIAQVLGSDIEESTSDKYLLASGPNAASVILYNQFSDSDFDGLLDQEDDTNNKFAVIKFSPNEQVNFGGQEIVFKGTKDNDSELQGSFMINNEIDLTVSIDEVTLAKNINFVGREFFKQGRNEYAIVFLRAGN